MRGAARRAILGLAAAAGPAAVLHASEGTAPEAPGLGGLPFAPPGLLVAHLVAAIPLGWTLGARLGRLVPRIGPLAWAGLGVLVAAGFAVLGPTLAMVLDAMEAGFLVRAAARTAITVLLVTPWFVPAAGRMSGPTSAVGLASALLLAIAPPLAFAARLTETRTDEAASHLEAGRLGKAEAALRDLVEIGSWRPIGGASVSASRRSIAESVRRLRRAASRPLTAEATGPERLERAFVLIQIGREDEAATLLRPLSSSDPDALLLLAALDRDRGLWEESERGYRRALGPGGVVDPDRSFLAYDGLIESLSAAGRPGDATALCREAAGRLPRRAGYFAMQTGRLELEAGRPAAALAALTEALRREPSLADRVRPLLRQIRVRTPACLLRSSSP